ncbi:hypothetical protein OpiT1DRAFT_05922 [Opitutaceae bacterium TAV1]|nr:hypothetical protein OpiT1DRAFT_05922 [Opitutaceae bacterium TAV1]
MNCYATEKQQYTAGTDPQNADTDGEELNPILYQPASGGYEMITV